MNKIISFLIFILYSFGLNAQVFTPIHNYQAPDGLAVAKAFGIPYGHDTTWNGVNPSINGVISKVPGFLFFQTSDNILYAWDGGKWIPSGAGGGSSIDTIKVTDDLYVVRDLTGHQVLGHYRPNGLVSGGVVTLDTCMKIDVTPAVYIIITRQFVSRQFLAIPILPADLTFGRIDRVVGDTSGNVFIITGTPSPTPTAPPFNPSSQIEFAQITVPAGATCLPINQEIVFDGIIDDPSQWDTATSGTITVDFSDVNAPFHKNQAAYIHTYTNGSSITLTKHAGYDTVKAGDVFKTPLRLNGALLNGIQVEFLKDGSPVSANQVINPYFSSLDSDFYQIPSIPFIFWPFPGGNVYNAVKYTFTGDDLSGAKGLRLDYIQIQTGNNNIPTSLVLTTDSTSGPATLIGNILNIPIYSGGGGGGTQATIYTKDSSLNGDRNVDIATHALTFNNAGSFNVNAIDNGSIGFAVGSASTSLFLFDSTIAGIAHSDANGFSVMEETLNGIEINSPYPIYLGQTHTGTNLSQVHINSGIGNITTDAVLTLNRSTGVVDTVNASSFGGTVLANNGLTKVVDSIQLGGTLTAATTISGNTFTLSVLGSVASPNAQFKVSNSGTGEGVNINSTSGTGLEVVSSSGIGSIITATAGTGLVLGSGSGLPLEVQANPSSTNTVISMASLERFTSGTAANGIGASVDFSLENATSFGVSNQLISKWTDATNATRTSEFSITGVNSASTSTLFTLSGSGALKLNQYASGAFYHNDTTNYKPVIIDASGNIFQGSWAGSGGTVPNFAFNENHTGSTSTTITLAHNYTSGTERVFKNGVRIQIPTDFSESGANTLLLASAPLVSDNFTIDFNY